MSFVPASNSSIDSAWLSEWHALQEEFAQQDTSALQIKLLAVVLTALGVWLAMPWLLGSLLLLLWGQEAILRTQQARLAQRLLQVELALRQASTTEVPLQLHSWWQQQRGGTWQLLREYGCHALRLTVIFPYALLLMWPLALIGW